ncbi:MAG TPA: hypothetical protein VNW95_12290 [Mucilaginibacter sp.]|jgi:hypothetical protein|nr:hypothetical protein [Mucilaginibacter sp.]
MTPDLLVAMVSASMQAIDLWLNFRDKEKVNAVMNQVDYLQSSPQIQEEGDNLLLLIPVDVFDILSNRVQACFDKYKAMFDNNYEYLPAELDEATEALKRCICRELSRIYSLNGRIPDGTLSHYWNQYSCSNTTRREYATVGEGGIVNSVFFNE